MIASGRQPNPKTNNRSAIIAILALLLFALSGLLTGFATGTFYPKKQTAQRNNTINNNNKTNAAGNTTATPVQTQTPQVTQTPDILVVGLGCPGVQYSVQEVRGMSYQVQAQVLTKASDCNGKPLHMTGITCRLWLTKDSNFDANIPKDRIKSVDTLKEPFPKEEENALAFSNTTPQVQPCNAQGPTMWNYQLSPSLDKGTYYLIVLANYQGTLYNWTAKLITVTKEG